MDAQQGGEDLHVDQPDSIGEQSHGPGDASPSPVAASRAGNPPPAAWVHLGQPVQSPRQGCQTGAKIPGDEFEDAGKLPLQEADPPDSPDDEHGNRDSQRRSGRRRRPRSGYRSRGTSVHRRRGNRNPPTSAGHRRPAPARLLDEPTEPAIEAGEHPARLRFHGEPFEPAESHRLGGRARVRASRPRGSRPDRGRTCPRRPPP